MRGYVTRSVNLQENGTVIYDVVYSTTKNGSRSTPQHPEAKEAVVFFGCSVTFGEGLNDNESFPFIVGEILGKQYQVFNFGFHGYGSHHMLAQIENGYLDDIVKKYKKIHVRYVTISGHELRSGGLSSWGLSDPRYVMHEGKLIRDGDFTRIQGEGPVQNFLRRLLSDLKSYRKIALAINKYDYSDFAEHHANVIEAAQNEIKAKGIDNFSVVLWPGAEVTFGNHFARKNFTMLTLAQETPMLMQNPEKYTIIGDGHPNALAAREVAKVLAAEIQKHQ